MKIAIVCDWLVTYAGAEKVLEQMLNVFPEADLFAVVDFLPEGQRDFIKNKKVTTTFIQNLPRARKKYRNYLPFMPIAIEQLDLSGYDVVISSSHCVAKGVLTGPDQIHISYGVDYFIANSHFIARRIWKCYRREAEVIYPPVDVDKFTFCDKKEDFYLTASRMVPYKKMDLIVEAFSKMPDKQLIVIGQGPDFNKIKKLAGPNVKLMGYQPDSVLQDYMQRAKAFIFAAEEDFGITPVEAQACGTPVIAYGKGGSLETVRGYGKAAKPTGIFFYKQKVQDLMDAVISFEKTAENLSAKNCRENAERFAIPVFRKNFQNFVESVIKKQ